MSPGPSTDRRLHPRKPLVAGVRFAHEPSRRDFPGRAVDVSEGGMLMYVPATVPIKVGQSLRLEIGKSPDAQSEPLSEQPVYATVVRVDRHKLIKLGHLAVGVKFVKPDEEH